MVVKNPFVKAIGKIGRYRQADSRIYTMPGLPDPTASLGQVIYVTNGAAGAPCLAVSDGTTWHRVVLGAAVSTTV